MDSRCKLQSAVADLTEAEASTLIEDLINRDIAMSKPLLRLGDVLRVDNILRQEAKERAKTGMTYLNEDLFLDSAERAREMAESMVNHGDYQNDILS